MLDIINDYVGIFFRTAEQDKWHWRDECPETPYTNSLFCSRVPDIDQLCKTCLEIEIDELKELGLL